MSAETKDWIGDVEVFRHGGGGFGAAINGANAFHPAPLGDHNKPLCQFRIAHGLPSREAAEGAAREWVSRQAEALGLFRDRDARIAELEAQVRTAGAEALEKMGERLRKMLKEGGSSTACRYCFRQAADECETEARRLRGEGEA